MVSSFRAYHGVLPQNSRDPLGRERFHQEAPQTMYHMPDKIYQIFDSHIPGGMSLGKECCSDQSITFHHIKEFQMKLLK